MNGARCYIMVFASNSPSRVHLYRCRWLQPLQPKDHFDHSSTGVLELKQGKINPWIRCIQKLLDSRTKCQSKTVQTQEVSGLWALWTLSHWATHYNSPVSHQRLHRHHHLNNKTPNQSVPPNQRPWFNNTVLLRAWDTALTSRNREEQWHDYIGTHDQW